MRPVYILFAVSILAVFGLTAVKAQTAEAFFAKCDASFESGKYSDAVKECSKALEAKPGFEDALITRAGAYKILRIYPAAIADYTELIRVTNGMAMAYFYRAGVSVKTGKDNEAIADLTASIKKDAKGLFAARSHYERGLIYDKLGKADAAQADYRDAVTLKPDFAQAKAKIKYPFGGKTLTEAALDVLPIAKTPNDTLFEKPIPSPGAETKPMPAVPAKAVQASAPAGWKRMALTGTGLSVASPVPYVLTNDKPDPLLEAMTANVSWEMTDGGLWATVRYQKWDQKFTAVRQVLDKTVNIIFDNPKAGEQFVKDTKFLSQPAAVIDQERFDRYDKKQVRQKMIVFGKPDDYTQLNFVHPADDKIAAAKVDQIIATFKKEGVVVAAETKLPPANWKTYNFGGLLFDFPAPPTNGPCASPELEGETKICGKWGDPNELTIDVVYRNYVNSAAPSISKAAADHLRFTKEIEAGDNGWKEYKNENVTINTGEAIKVSNASGFSRTDTIFVRRGNEVWKVTIWHFNRWDAVRDAVTRVLGSIKFKY